MTKTVYIKVILLLLFFFLIIFLKSDYLLYLCYICFNLVNNIINIKYKKCLRENKTKNEVKERYKNLSQLVKIGVVLINLLLV